MRAQSRLVRWLSESVSGIRRGLCVLGLLTVTAQAQFVYFESFRDSTAPGWSLNGGGTSPGPRLTAGADPAPQDPESSAPQLDVDGNGWLRLATTTGNQDNNVYLDTSIPSSANEITISFDFTAWDKSATTGADGISVFLWDADVPFAEGANGGSLSYAQKSGVGADSGPGLSGAYVGVGLDVFGNFSNATEGRTGSDPTMTVGGTSQNPGFLPNQVVVRGPDTSVAQDGTGSYYYLAGTGGKDYTSAGDTTIPTLSSYNPGNGNLAFPDQDFRPDQDASQYRRFQMTLNDLDQLSVYVEFGYGTGYILLYTVDLSGFARPENLRIGFGSATGGTNQVYEIRNLLITADGIDGTWYWTDAELTNDRLWSSNTNWTPQTVPGEASNMYADVVFSNQFSTSPLAPATVIVDGGDKTLGDIYFSGKYGFTLTSQSTQKFIMDTNGSGASEINILNNPEGNADHVINPNLDLRNQLNISNLVAQSLTFNGAIDTNGHNIVVDSVGTTNLNGIISEGGAITKTGDGLLVLSGNNTYTGNTTVNNGILRIANNNALGNSGNDTYVTSGGTLALSNNITVPVGEAVSIAGTGEGGIGALTNTSGNNTWQGGVTLTAASTIGAQSGTLTFSNGNINNAGYAVTFKPDTSATQQVNSNVTGSGAVIKSGAGTTIFNGSNNTYSGLTTVNAGTLQIQNSNGLGTTAAGTVVNSGGTLALANSVNIASGEAFTISGSGDTGKAALWSQGGTNTINGTVALTGGSGSFGAASGQTLTLNGVVSGSNQDAIIKGPGVVQYGANMTYTGDTLIQSGTLRYLSGGNRIADTSDVVVSSGANWDLANYSDTVGSVAGAGNIQLGNGTVTAGGNNVNTTYSGVMSGTGNFTKTGTGTTTFSGANTFTGNLTVSSGTMALGANNVFHDDMDMVLSGGTFQTTGYADTFDNLTLTSSSIIDFMGASGGYLTFDDMTRTGGTLTIDNWAGSLSGNGGTRLQVTASSVGGSLLSNTTFTGWGGAQMVNLGGGLYEIVPTTTGFTRWDDGASNDNWNSNQNWVGDSTNPNGVGAKAYFGNDPSNAAQTVILSDGNKTLGNMIIDGTGNRNYNFTASGGNRTLTFDQTGTATATLVVGGSQSNVIGSTNNNNTRVSVALNDNLLIQNNSTATTGLTFGTLNGSHTFALNSQTLTVTGSSETIINSLVSGTGGIVMNGPGILELSDNSNSYSGGTTLNSGRIELRNNDVLGTGTLTINGGSIAGIANASGDRNPNNAYTVNNSFTIANVDGTDLAFDGAGTLSSGQKTITVESGIDTRFNGNVTGTGGIVKEGGGSMTFAAANSTFSGGLTVNAGTAQVNSGAANINIGSVVSGANYLGAGKVTVGSSGTLTAATTGDVTVASTGILANNGGTLTVTGSGTDSDFFLNGQLNQTGGTTTITGTDDFEMGVNSRLSVSGGTMNINPTDQFATLGTSGNAALISVSNGATLNVNISATGGTENNVLIGQYDTLTVDGSGTKLNITGQTNSNIDLDGRVNISNGGVIEVLSGETNLRSTNILDGGTGVTKGTLIVHGDLNVQNPALAHAPNITINADSGNTEIAAISGVESIENIGVLRKTGSGTTTINTNVNNIQAQLIRIDGGTLLNGDSNQIENNTPMNLAGGTWNTGGYDEVLGTLTLSASSTINLGTGDSVINYANSSAQTWTGGTTLNVTNWSGSATGGGTDQLYFGTSSSGLTSGQLQKILFINPFGNGLNYNARILSTGEVVPFNAVPEPSTYFFGGALASLLAWLERKRLQKLRAFFSTKK